MRWKRENEITSIPEKHSRGLVLRPVAKLLAHFRGKLNAAPSMQSYSKEGGTRALDDRVFLTQFSTST